MTDTSQPPRRSRRQSAAVNTPATEGRIAEPAAAANLPDAGGSQVILPDVAADMQTLESDAATTQTEPGSKLAHNLLDTCSHLFWFWQQWVIGLFCAGWYTRPIFVFRRS